MALITGTTAAIDIDQQWTAELNDAVQFETVIDGMFADRSNLLPHGNILNEPSRHNNTANTKSASTPATPEAITETGQTYTVSLQQIVAVEIEDLPEIQSKYDLRAAFTTSGAYALARARDVNAATLFGNNTLQTVGSLGSELTVDNIIRIRQYLRDTPVKGEWKGVVSPATYSGFLKVDMFVNQLYNGDDSGMALEKAKVGKLFNITFYESQLLSGTAPSSTGAVWAAGHYFKIIQRAPTTHSWYSPLDTAWIVTMDQLYGDFERQEPDEAAAATTAARLGSVRIQAAK